MSYRETPPFAAHYTPTVRNEIQGATRDVRLRLNLLTTHLSIVHDWLEDPQGMTCGNAVEISQHASALHAALMLLDRLRAIERGTP